MSLQRVRGFCLLNTCGQPPFACLTAGWRIPSLNACAKFHSHASFILTPPPNVICGMTSKRTRTRAARQLCFETHLQATLQPCRPPHPSFTAAAPRDCGDSRYGGNSHYMGHLWGALRKAQTRPCLFSGLSLVWLLRKRWVSPSWLGRQIVALEAEGSSPFTHPSKIRRLTCFASSAAFHFPKTKPDACGAAR